MSQRSLKSTAIKALTNGTLFKLADELEKEGYRCQAGYLQLNTKWQTLLAFLRMGKEEKKI